MVERRPLVRTGGRVGQMPTGDTVPGDTLPSNVSALAALIGAANKVAYFTGPGAMSLADFTVFARLWCALADEAAGRTLLGLGTAATRNATTSSTDTTSERLWRTNDLVKTTSNTDSTAGRMLRVGDGGMLGNAVSPPSGNADTINASGWYIITGANFGTLPSSAGNVLHVERGSSNQATQIFDQLISGSVSKLWIRSKNSSGVWTTAGEIWHSANFDPTLKANLASPTFTGTVTFNGSVTLPVGNTNAIGPILFEADNYGSAWARGTDFTDAGVRQAGVGAFGSAGTVTKLYFGWGSSPWAGTHRIEATSLGVELFGTPKTPTAAAGTNTTQIASTAFATSKTKVITTRSATSYTFVLADNVDVYNRFTNASASTCTVPPNSSVAYPIGHVIPIRRAAAANLTLTPGAGVTLNAPSGGTLVMTNNMTAELIKVATDTWDVVGQTVAV